MQCVITVWHWKAFNDPCQSALYQVWTRTLLLAQTHGQWWSKVIKLGVAPSHTRLPINKRYRQDNCWNKIYQWRTPAGPAFRRVNFMRGNSAVAFGTQPHHVTPTTLRCTWQQFPWIREGASGHSAKANHLYESLSNQQWRRSTMSFGLLWRNGRRCEAFYRFFILAYTFMT